MIGMKIFVLFVILSVLIISPVGKAQIPLQPGQTIFTVQSIQIATVQLKGNYSTTGSYYLNVYWNTVSIVAGTANINTTCYLNCNPQTDDCSPAQNVQNCSYIGPTGIAACTILNPSYNFYDFSKSNSVYCQFSDPQSGKLYWDTKTGNPYYKIDFMPVKFNIWLSNVTAIIGKEFNLQVNVKNIGLLDDKYNVTVSTNEPNILFINPQTNQSFIGTLKGDSYLSTPETGFSYAKLIVLTDEPCVCITVNSTIKADVEGNYATVSTDCPAKNCVKIRSKMASLPDFGLWGILQIILFAAILALLKF